MAGSDPKLEQGGKFYNLPPWLEQPTLVRTLPYFANLASESVISTFVWKMHM